MKSKDINLAEELGKSLFNNIIDPALDVMEIPVDTLFEDDSLLQAIPILKSIHSVGRSCVAIRDKYLYKRLVVFIQEINSGEVSKKKKEYLEKIAKDNAFKAELERLLHFIDLCSYEEQAKYLGRFFKAYVNEEISWEVLQELAEANQRMFIGDYKVLQRLVSIRDDKWIKVDNRSTANRLISLGLCNELQAGVDYESNIKTMRIDPMYISNMFILTKFGETFGKYLDNKELDIYEEVWYSVDRSSKYTSPKDKKTETNKSIEGL